jgi:transcriptional regulator with XRE-family HTH domain
MSFLLTKDLHRKKVRNMNYQPEKNNLEKYRLKRNLTQDDVAKMMGFKSTSRISAWEHGKNVPNLENLFALAEIYHATTEQLYPYTKKQARRKLTEAIKAPEPAIYAKSNDELVDEFAELLVELYLEQIRK